MDKRTEKQRLREVREHHEPEVEEANGEGTQDGAARTRETHGDRRGGDDQTSRSCAGAERGRGGGEGGGGGGGGEGEERRGGGAGGGGESGAGGRERGREAKFRLWAKGACARTAKVVD